MSASPGVPASGGFKRSSGIIAYSRISAQDTDQGSDIASDAHLKMIRLATNVIATHFGTDPLPCHRECNGTFAGGALEACMDPYRFP